MARRGFEFLARVADQRVDPDRRLGLVVHGAARIERAVLLHEHERIARPVLAFRFHHVDMRQQQHRPCLRVGAREHGEQSAFLGMVGRGEHLRLLDARRFQVAPPCARPPACSSRSTAWCWFRPAPCTTREIPARPRGTSSRRPKRRWRGPSRRRLARREHCGFGACLLPGVRCAGYYGRARRIRKTAPGKIVISGRVFC